jgi:chaperonin GroES
MKIRPLHDRVLVERVDEEQTTAGGIIIPDTAKEKPQEGLVVAGGSEVNLDGNEYVILREDDILAVVG